MTKNADTLTVEVGLPYERTPDVHAFLRHHYGEQFYGAEETYFDWQYLQAPCIWFDPLKAQKRLPINAVLDGDNGEILALHAFVPFDANLNGRIGRGVWDTEWINGSGIRGLGQKLAKTLIGMCDVYGGFAMNDMADHAFRKLGLTIFPEIHRRVAVLDRNTLGGLMRAAGYASEADALPPEFRHEGHSYSLLPAASEVPPHILERRRNDVGFSVIRDADWLEWRFDRHPFIDYAAVAADERGDNGLAVVRLEAIVGTPYVVCRVVEFLPEQNHEAELIAAIVGFAQEKNALIVDYFTTSAGFAGYFDQAADRGGMNFQNNPRVPYMYQPLAFNDRNAMNMAIAVSEPYSSAVDLAEFYATKADSDQDILRSPESAPAF